MRQQLRFPFVHPPDPALERERRRELFRRPLAMESIWTGRPAVAEAPVSRDRLRSRRARGVRARTESVRNQSKRQLELGRLLYPMEEFVDVVRPRTRADCAAVPRPCPFVGCSHHLYLDVSARSGALKLNFPDLEPHELPATASCVLDVTEGAPDGLPLQTVGDHLNLTRERVRQEEVRLLAKLASVHDLVSLRDVVDGRPGQREMRRHLPVVQDGDFDAAQFASPDLDEE